MSIATARALDMALGTSSTVSREIEQFLNGETSGELLLEALYGAVSEEPIPDRLLAVVRAAR